MKLACILVASGMSLTACSAPARPSLAPAASHSPQVKAVSDLPLRVVETLHERLKTRCTELWTDMNFDGGLLYGPGWGLQVGSDSWNWEFSRFKDSGLRDYWPISSWGQLRQAGSQDIGSVSLHHWDDRQREQRLRIAGEIVSVFVRHPDELALPNFFQQQSPPMTLAQFVQSMDDAAWPAGYGAEVRRPAPVP